MGTHCKALQMLYSMFLKEFRECEKSHLCSHPQEKKTREQLRGQVSGERKKNEDFLRPKQ